MNLLDDDIKSLFEREEEITMVPTYQSLGARTWSVNRILFESGTYNCMLFEYVKPANSRHTTFKGVIKYYKNVDRKRTN